MRVFRLQYTVRSLLVRARLHLNELPGGSARVGAAVRDRDGVAASDGKTLSRDRINQFSLAVPHIPLGFDIEW